MLLKSFTSHHAAIVFCNKLCIYMCAPLNYMLLISVLLECSRGQLSCSYLHHDGYLGQVPRLIGLKELGDVLLIDLGLTQVHGCLGDVNDGNERVLLWEADKLSYLLSSVLLTMRWIATIEEIYVLLALLSVRDIWYRSDVRLSNGLQGSLCQLFLSLPSTFQMIQKWRINMLETSCIIGTS